MACLQLRFRRAEYGVALEVVAWAGEAGYAHDALRVQPSLALCFLPSPSALPSL